MERCPNCDSPVRSGARFCTACGHRLPPSGDDQPVATGEAETNQDAAMAAPPVWESAATGVEQPATSPEDWLRRRPVASADLWPASARATDASRVTGNAEGAEVDMPTSTDAGTDDAERVTAAAESDEVIWPSSPWSSWTMPETDVATDGETTDQPAAGATSGDESGADELPADVQAAFGGAEVAAQPATTGEPEVPAPTEVAPAESGSERATGDAFGRALALIDELRGLLPAVAGVAGIDLAGAVAELTAGRREAALPEGGDLDRLEVAVAAARERPREIDALFGLSGNVDGLAAVVAAHRRHAEAIDRALALLGGSAATGTEASAGPGENTEG
jgi:hypothetical protein